MTKRMAQVERLAQSVFLRVGLDDALLHLYRLHHQLRERLPIGIGEVEIQHFGPGLFRVDESVLEHFGITRQEILLVKRLQEWGVEDDAVGIVEYAHFVFQTVEVDACLSAHAGVDHCEQRCRDVDEVDAALEGGCGKTA